MTVPIPAEMVLRVPDANPPLVAFHQEDGQEIGRLWIERGALHFEGAADRSALVFMDALATAWAKRE